MWQDNIHQYTISFTARVGSEAAAVTGITFSGVDFLIQFKASHPFIVLITEQSTGAILFMGRMCSPLSRNSAPDCDFFSGSGQSD